MIRFPASPRASGAGAPHMTAPHMTAPGMAAPEMTAPGMTARDMAAHDLTALEYGVVAAFVLIALFAAVPALAGTAKTLFQRLA